MIDFLQPAAEPDPVDAWNAANPPGTPVVVRQGDGSVFVSATASDAWYRGDTPVVRLAGFFGACDLSRVRRQGGR